MSETAAGSPAPLHVATDLVVTMDGMEVQVSSTGERLFVEFPSLVGAARALRALPAADRTRLHSVLAAGDLSLEVRVRDRTVGVLGAGAGSGVLSRELGASPGSIRLCGLLATVPGEVTAFVDYLRAFRG